MEKLDVQSAAPHPLALGFCTFRSGQTWQLGAGTYEGRENWAIGKVEISLHFPTAFSNFWFTNSLYLYGRPIQYGVLTLLKRLHACAMILFLPLCLLSWAHARLSVCSPSMLRMLCAAWHLSPTVSQSGVSLGRMVLHLFPVCLRMPCGILRLCSTCLPLFSRLSPICLSPVSLKFFAWLLLVSNFAVGALGTSLPLVSQHSARAPWAAWFPKRSQLKRRTSLRRKNSPCFPLVFCPCLRRNYLFPTYLSLLFCFWLSPARQKLLSYHLSPTCPTFPIFPFPPFVSVLIFLVASETWQGGRMMIGVRADDYWCPQV